MIDLSDVSGLPLALDVAHPRLPLRLSGSLQPGTLSERSLAELRQTLIDPAAEGPDPAYFMYNGVFTLRAAEGSVAYAWRYDLTVLPVGRYGREYLRTMGHYHPQLPGQSEAFPEVYEVLYGSALFILQKATDEQLAPRSMRVEDVIIVHASVGEKVMLLPNYGHWTVNVGESPLVISNWVCASFRSLYEPVIQARGPAVRVVAGANGPTYEANRTYSYLPQSIKYARPVPVPALGLEAGQPIFNGLLGQPHLWRYLCTPAAREQELGAAIEVLRTEPFPAHEL